MLLHELAEATAELAQREPMMEEEDDGDTLGSLGGSPSSQPRARGAGLRWPFYWTRRLWESGARRSSCYQAAPPGSARTHTHPE